ncbi:E3 ubiquitin-protein ligase TRIM21-like isoform 2-T2 [Polymixia lowei]
MYQYWDTKDKQQCPLCNEIFYGKPVLRVNTFIAGMAEKVKKGQAKAAGKPDQQPAKSGNENVFCDICTGAKVTAVKSCLVCLNSYCATHLEPHQRIPALKRHKLIHPVENLEDMICKEHHRPLELFCKADQTFVCEFCTDGEHKNHKTVSLEEEFQTQKAQLEITEVEMRETIQKRQQKIHEIQTSVETSKNNSERALADSAQVMTALQHYIKRSQVEFAEAIEEKQKRITTQAEGFIKQLEEEVTQLTQKEHMLRQFSINEDPFQFLQGLRSLTIATPQTKDWSEVSLDSDQWTVGKAVAQLEEKVVREVRMVCDPDLKRMRQHSVDLTLDPDTAHPLLTLSEDGKQVKHGDRKQNLQNKQERFDHVLNVLAKEGFCSGKFYYEVQVKDKTMWDLGVAKESINRKGDIRLNPKSGYWTIWLRKGAEYTANAGPAVFLPLREKPQKVGVFVDYERGQVSFYDVEARACLYSFTGCVFTEKLFPFFSPCANVGGKNSAPLVITPVKYSG